MKQSSELEDIFTSVRALSTTQQKPIKMVLLDMVEQVRDTAAWERHMQNPHYRAYVERGLDEAEEDRLAGRVFSLSEVKERISRRKKARHAGI